MIRNVNLLYKLQFLYFPLLIVATLLVLLFLFSNIEISSAQAKQKKFFADENVVGVSDNPNVVTGGMFAAANEIGKTAVALESTASTSLQIVSQTARQGGDFVAKSIGSLTRNLASGVVVLLRTTGNILGSITSHAGSSLKFMVNVVGNGFGSAAGTIGSGARNALSVPGKTLKNISNSSIVSDFIRPSDHAPSVPIIDPDSLELKEALSAIRTQNPSQTTQNVGSKPTWPIHGRITTDFGVNHWPYQATHTGIDISDGKPSGVTPVKPFKPGRIIEAVKSSEGLGNHVVIDHGRGVTSVYAHLASISVDSGQLVDKTITLGFAGSTGVSTGPHVHFEIRVNGKAADPHFFIDGQP